MTGYRTIAKKIPDRVRRDLLLTDADPIGNASSNVENLKLLHRIWNEFIERMPLEDLVCRLCVARLVNNFREMRPTLEELEKEDQLLKAMKDGRARG